MMITPMDYWKNGVELWFRTAEAQLELSFRVAALMPTWDVALVSARGVRDDRVTLRSTTARPALRMVTGSAPVAPPAKPKAAAKPVRLRKAAPKAAVSTPEVVPAAVTKPEPTKVPARETAKPVEPVAVVPPEPVKAPVLVSETPAAKVPTPEKAATTDTVVKAVQSGPAKASPEPAEHSKPADVKTVAPGLVKADEARKVAAKPAKTAARATTKPKAKPVQEKSKAEAVQPGNADGATAVAEGDTNVAGAARSRRRRAPAQLGMPPAVSKVPGNS
jgi:hypothetical protein